MVRNGDLTLRRDDSNSGSQRLLKFMTNDYKDNSTISTNKILTSRLKSTSHRGGSKKLKTIIRNGELRSNHSATKSNKRYASQKSSQKSPKKSTTGEKVVFADAEEENKYKQYIKSVKMLN